MSPRCRDHAKRIKGLTFLNTSRSERSSRISHPSLIHSAAPPWVLRLGFVVRRDWKFAESGKPETAGRKVLQRNDPPCRSNARVIESLCPPPPPRSREKD